MDYESPRKFSLFASSQKSDFSDSSPLGGKETNPRFGDFGSKSDGTPKTPFSFVQTKLFSSGSSSGSDASPGIFALGRQNNRGSGSSSSPFFKNNDRGSGTSSSPFLQDNNRGSGTLSSPFFRPQKPGSSFTTSPFVGFGTAFSPAAFLPRSGGSRTKTPAARTPGVNSTTTTTSDGSSKSHVIVAVVEGRGLAKGEIGLASIDVRHSELCLCQFSDTAAYAKLRVKLHILNPAEIIVPDSAVEKGGNMLALLESLRQDFPKMKVFPVKRKYFNECHAVEQIIRIKTDDGATVEKDIRDKYYALASGCALIKHIEYVQNIVFAKRSVKVTYKGTEQTCMIDIGTAKHLELIVNLQDATDVDHSLYGIMNHTFTAGGARMLRASLLQPSADVALINSRLDAIAELKSDMPQFHALRSLISRMLDVDQLVALCSHLYREETPKTAEYKITQTIYLKHTLELVDGLQELLGKYTSPLFKSWREMLMDDRFKEILEKINSTLREETRYEKNALNMQSQKCFAIKPSVNGFLDVARRTYSELIADVEELCTDVAEETNLPLTVAYSGRREFYLQMRLKNDAPLPSQFSTSCLINLTRKANTISCTTRNLIKLNDRIAQTVNEIFTMSNSIVTDLLAAVRDSITCLYNLTEVVSMVDFICSLTLVCAECPDGFIRPLFSDKLAISQGRHPLLEKSCDGSVYYPNDIYAGPESNFIIITGPNMAGKSTFLKMVAVLQVMAQMGSYVPANYASFRTTDQILSRVGQNDDLENNCSAFMLEMKDMNYILQNKGEKSLIIIDELARSTSPEEGIGICHAICEDLINSGAFVFFATHFHELTVLDSLYQNVENYHFEGETNEEEEATAVVVNHTLKRGAYRSTSYGFEIAELAGFPPQVVTRAKAIADEKRSQLRISDIDESAARKNRAATRLGYRLIQASRMQMDPSKFTEYLRHIRKRHLGELNSAQLGVPLANTSFESGSSNSTLGSSSSSSSGSGGGSGNSSF